MGLVYSSGESSGLINALNSNINSGKEAVNQLKSGSQKVVAAVDGRTLSGAAYTAGKGLFSELVIPTIDRVTSAFSTIEGELQEYKSADSLVSSEGLLDEDNLNQQIRTKTRMKSSVDATAAFARAAARNNPVAAMVNVLFNLQSRLKLMSFTLELEINKLNQKLEKLHNFNSQTSGLFSSSLDDMNLAMQGVLVLSKTTINSDGTYTLPIGMDKTWFTTKKDVDGWMKSPASAIENMPKNMTAEETESWLIENLEKYGPDFMMLLEEVQNVGESLISFKNGKAFLNGIAITQDKMGRLRWGDRKLWKPGYTFKHGKNFGEASGIDLGDYHYSRLPDGGINYSELAAAGWTGFKDAVNPINDFKGWKNASKFGKFGKGMGIVGTGVTIASNFADNVDLSDGLDGREVVNFATDTAIDVGVGAGAAGVGAMVGSFVVPPLGTVIGAGVGMGINLAMNHKFGTPKKSTVDRVKDGVKKATKALGNIFGGINLGFGG